LNILSFSIKEIKKLLKDKKVSEKELCDYYFKRIKKYNNKINSFISLNEDKSNFGIPVSVKDNFLLLGTKTTCASKILENYESTYDATVCEKLKKNGFFILGKNNMDEFAMGSSNENSFFGACKNPWNTSYVPGGSSGGGASSVASGLSQVSFGTDTGGSVRLPASYCGVLGFKPSYGRISRYGIVAFASSFDQVGIMARNVDDLESTYNSVLGFDKKDLSTSRNQDNLSSFKENYTIGIPSDIFKEGVQKEVLDSLDNFKELFTKKNVKFKEIKLNYIKHAIDAYYVLATGEASSNLSRFDGIRYGYRAKDFKNLKDLYSKTRGQGFGKEVIRRIVLGTFVLSQGYYDAYFSKASKVRNLIKKELFSVLKDCDFILTPTSPTTAFKIGEKVNDPVSMYLNDIFTTTANLSTLPAVSFPYGFDKKGLPIGLQLIGGHFKEKIMFDFLKLIQKERSDLFNVIPEDFKG
jgi:aspartyl-tRNA(Asn)/glutamyl-tRNA(Gln) amidotransferase subunit A